MGVAVNQSDKYSLVPVYNRIGDRVSNLFTRNGRFYAQCQVRGRRHVRACPEEGRAAAVTWTKDFVRRVRSEDPRAIRETCTRSPYPKLGQIVKVYQAAAERQYAIDGRPLPATVRANIRQLYNVVGHRHKAGRPEELGSEVLSEDLAASFFEERVTAAGADEMLKVRARVTAASTLRQAKCVFAKWVRPRYREAGMSLPASVDAFCSAGRSVRSGKYRLPPEDLRKKTFAAAEQLRVDRPDLYLVFLLCYDLGMRAGEAVEARWDWIEMNGLSGGSRRVMRICARSYWRGPKNLVDHAVPVSDALWAELQALRLSDADHVLPGGSPTARRNLIQREFAAWLRSLGWSRSVYPKAAHELRKLAGSIWYTKADLKWAAAWLGDSAATVYHYYADLTEAREAVVMR